MLDLKAQLGDYLDHVVQRVDVEDVLEQRTGPEPVRPIRPRKAPFRLPGWSYAAAAAVLVLLLIGGAAWLSGRAEAPPADTPPTTAEVSPTTEAATTTSTVAATSTTLATVPIVPPGEGPILSFVQAEAPTDGRLGSGVWFNGAL